MTTSTYESEGQNNMLELSTQNADSVVTCRVTVDGNDYDKVNTIDVIGTLIKTAAILLETVLSSHNDSHSYTPTLSRDSHNVTNRTKRSSGHPFLPGNRIRHRAYRYILVCGGRYVQGIYKYRWLHRHQGTCPSPVQTHHNYLIEIWNKIQLSVKYCNRFTLNWPR